MQLGKTFNHFLTVYGEQFSPQHFRIDENSDYVEINQNDSQAYYTTSTSSLQLIDTINTSNNIGKHTFNFYQVQNQLRVTRTSL